MLLNMLACESRMVAHVTICTVDAWIFAMLLKRKRLTDPTDVGLLLLWWQLVTLFHWAWNVRIREQIFEAGLNLFECMPLKTFSPLDRCASRCQQEQIGHAWKIPWTTSPELDPSHVQALLEDLEPFCCCHSLRSWTRPIHGCSSWSPNASTIEVSKSCMYATHSQSCSGTDHHLLVSFCWTGMIDMAIIPWRWNLRKVLRYCQDCIEAIDHVIRVIEGHRCIKITLP